MIAHGRRAVGADVLGDVTPQDEVAVVTRDHFRASHRTPPHLVVRVDEFGARVFWVVGVRVTLLETVERLPMGVSRPTAPSSATGVDGRAELLGRTVDCVVRVRDQRPAPLVLAGDRVLVGELKAEERIVHRLAGEVVGPAAGDADRLFLASSLCLVDYLHRRGQEALDDLYDALLDDPARVVAGLDDCWEAVTRRVPGTLVVEHGYVHPRPRGDGGPNGSHDLVDDMLELAHGAGNRIAFVDDAQLHEFGGVALLVPP